MKILNKMIINILIMIIKLLKNDNKNKNDDNSK